MMRKEEREKSRSKKIKYSGGGEDKTDENGNRESQQEKERPEQEGINDKHRRWSVALSFVVDYVRREKRAKTSRG
jgi:hypothetical protein